MIPQLATIRVQSRPGKRLRLWIPLLPIYIILTPLLPLAIVALVIGCARYRVSPIRVLVAATRLVAALSGFQVHVTHGFSTVQVRLT